MTSFELSEEREPFRASVGDFAERVPAVTEAVLGVDACPQGWVGIRLDGAGSFEAAELHADIAGLVVALGGSSELAVVGIDIPIGLPDRGERRADIEARARLGPRRSSIFNCPTRAAVDLDDFVTAQRVQRSLNGGKGMSRQSHGLRHKIRDVDRWVRSDTVLRVLEVHPELSFTTMNGAPLATSKKSWDGSAHRRRLLVEHGIEVPLDLGRAGRAGTDDVLDAAVVAWTARQALHGQARRVPQRPERFGDGIDAAIWF